MSAPKTFDGFLSMALTDSVNGCASGVREDAGEVAAGLSQHVRALCRDCGRVIGLRNKGEDGRCMACDDKAQAEAAALPRTPERLREWAKIMRSVVEKNHDMEESVLVECLAWAFRWEREAAELEAKR